MYSRRPPVGRALATVGAAFLVIVALVGCEASGGFEKCDAGSGCASLASVPTSTKAAHGDGRVVGVTGVLTALGTTSSVCIILAMDDGSRAVLVLPEGPRAAPEDSTDGAQLSATLIGSNGLGGLKTGERVIVTPDHRSTRTRVRGCPELDVIYAGWVTRFPN